MNPLTRLVSSAALAAALVGAIAAPALATPSPGPHTGGADHVVFVETDDTTGNHVVAYARADSGALTLAGSYATQGLGGSLLGAVVDRTASQGALAYDARHALLYAVNAGSDTVSVFAVDGNHLELRQVIESGGTFPVSITVHDNLVYVLNALDGGSVSGYRVAGGKLHGITGSVRPLGLTTPSDNSQFTHTPGQVTFSPDGSSVLVTTKAATGAVDLFGVVADGRLSAAPVVTSFAAGTVPFAIAFDAQGHAIVAVAGSSTVVTTTLNPDGTLTQIDSDATGQAATCWIVRAGDRFYASNAGSASLTGYQGDGAGQLTLIGNTSTGAGTVDAAATADGALVYVQTGAAGGIDGFRVNADGTLTTVGSVTVPNAIGAEGIVAV